MLIALDMLIDLEAATVVMMESSDFGYAVHAVDDNDEEFDEIIHSILRRFRHRV
jgi:hypothetical protein